MNTLNSLVKDAVAANLIPDPRKTFELQSLFDVMVKEVEGG